MRWSSERDATKVRYALMAASLMKRRKMKKKKNKQGKGKAEREVITHRRLHAGN